MPHPRRNAGRGKARRFRGCGRLVQHALCAMLYGVRSPSPSVLGNVVDPRGTLGQALVDEADTTDTDSLRLKEKGDYEEHPKLGSGRLETIRQAIIGGRTPYKMNCIHTKMLGSIFLGKYSNAFVDLFLQYLFGQDVDHTCPWAAGDARMVICSMKNCEAPSRVPISDVPTARSEKVSTKLSVARLSAMSSHTSNDSSGTRLPTSIESRILARSPLRYAQITAKSASFSTVFSTFPSVKSELSGTWNSNSITCDDFLEWGTWCNVMEDQREDYHRQRRRDLLPVGVGWQAQATTERNC
ncbi:hypothetical protein EJB05_07307, partial [Eragrostis curvula]